MIAQPLKILMASPEAVPFAKTGGLADVAGALPRALARLGHDVRLVLPRYGWIDGRAQGLAPALSLSVPMWAGVIEASVEQGRLPAGTGAPAAVPVYAIRHDPYFARRGLYQENGADYPDNLDRFAFFSRAVMELITALSAVAGWSPDVLHVHDWQTALCPVYLRTLYAGRPEHDRLVSVLSLHNLGFQGIFPAAEFPKTGLAWSLFTPQRLEFYGTINLLKGGLVFGDFLSTVSPTYSREIQTAELGFGLDGVVRERRDRLVGIVNGIDTDEWNPAADPHLPHRYAADDLSGKRLCKRALQRELKLPVRDVPVLAMVSRLTAQKGVDLVVEVLPDLMELDLQVVVLGTGDPVYESLLRALEARYPDRLAVRIGFDEPLAHRIEAAADLFLMPSRYEPCGLSQLHSLRYGTIPVVRRTGGLADTIVAYSPRAVKERRATGFAFGEAHPQDLLSAILLALRVYRERDEWGALIQAAMATDVSWTRSARAYVNLYRTALRVRWPEARRAEDDAD